MKPNDGLLQRWEAIVSQKRDAPAIFNSRGRLVFTFRGIDERARDFESKIKSFDAGSVVAIQIGNHEDWPSILIACLRRGVVVLPLEQRSSRRWESPMSILTSASFRFRIPTVSAIC